MCSGDAGSIGWVHRTPRASKLARVGPRWARNEPPSLAPTCTDASSSSEACWGRVARPCTASRYERSQSPLMSKCAPTNSKSSQPKADPGRAERFAAATLSVPSLALGSLPGRLLRRLDDRVGIVASGSILDAVQASSPNRLGSPNFPSVKRLRTTPRLADRAAATEPWASGQAPDLPELTVLQFHFDTERLAWVGFDPARALNHFIHISVVGGLSHLIGPDLEVADRTRSSR
jgi:hypothetical protein